MTQQNPRDNPRELKRAENRKDPEDVSPPTEAGLDHIAEMLDKQNSILSEIEGQLNLLFEYYNNEQLHQLYRIADALQGISQPPAAEQMPQQADSDDLDVIEGMKELLKEEGHPAIEELEFERIETDNWKGVTASIDGYIDAFDAHRDAMEAVGFEYNPDYGNSEIDLKDAEGVILEHHGGVKGE